MTTRADQPLSRLYEWALERRQRPTLPPHHRAVVISQIPHLLDAVQKRDTALLNGSHLEVGGRH